MDLNWFQIGQLPQNQIIGSYNYGLVGLSYLIATLASYVALDLAARLRAETSERVQMYWLIGGSFAMGAGIWSMHFIGMLAFIMPMPMTFALSWTIFSLVVAILASLLALYLLKNKNRPFYYMLIGGVFIGIGIATMHYMGMTGMTNHVAIRYLPSLFFLSIIIAILASEAALWFAMQSSQGSIRRQFYFKILSALIMGAAICGMHYTGMAAAVFTPLEGRHHDLTTPVLNPYLLSYGIAIITTLIIGLALTVSIYYRQMVTSIENKKEFLDAVLNNMLDGIIAVDAKGKITVCNEGISQYGKISKGISYLDLNNFFQLKLPHTDADVNIEQTPLYLALRGEHIRGKEYLLHYPNGEPKNVVIDGQPIINSEGQNLGAVIIIHDVTNLKQTEKIKQEFVSIVSHELRTPLTSIRGSLSLLLADVAGKMPEKMTHLLEIANNNTERLIRLINDILDVEKIEAGKMDFVLKDIDIVNVIQNAISDVKSLAEKNQVEIVFNYLGEAIVRGDYDKLVQVIVNLLSNAIRFSSPGQKVLVKLLETNTSTRVSVTDYGPGIPPEFQNRIFTKFSQADTSSARKKGGTGLGLSICKAIIEKHGGTIDYESIPNQFTCFYFDLPKEKAIAEAAPVDISMEKAELLICDSNPDSAELLQKFLRKHGIVADIALSVSAAKKLLKAKPYKMIAMDLILQDYDGIKFIQELRQDKTTSHIPITIISTQINLAKKEFSGSAFPIVNWLEKPLQPKQLNKILHYIRSEFKTALPNVLCVEDDPDISKIIQELLSSEAKVVTAFTVASAQEKLNSMPFDLIVLDLKLPDGLGTDLLPSINCKTRKIIPVVVFSAYELDHKYAHLVKQSLLKSRVSNKELLDVLNSVLLGF